MRSGTVGPASKTLGDALDRLAAAEATDARASVQAARDTYDSARTLILVALALGVAGSLGLGLLVARLVVRPVAAVRDGLTAMASGDLTVRVDVSSGDEVGHMAGALNQAAENLQTMVRSTAESTQALAAAADELSRGHRAARRGHSAGRIRRHRRHPRDHRDHRPDRRLPDHDRLGGSRSRAPRRRR
jgi:methyl-accepting chemotaxis protein